MAAIQKLLAAAVTSVVGKREERAVARLFTPAEPTPEKANSPA